MFERLQTLIDENTFNKIKNQKILLVGVGGVGGFVLESLVRTGFTNITIIDGDNIALSNLNRQIISNTTNIGTSKVMEAKKRAFSINPDINLTTKHIYLTTENFSEYINEKYDYIIDACDTINIKVKLIKYAQDNNISLITCLGMGKKLNAQYLEITTLNKTFNDALAKKLRYLLRQENLNLNIPVVFSKEEAKATGNVIGSAIFVPATAGILIANWVFLNILNHK